MSINVIPQDYDGVKDRHNDIKYGDRTSHYDENMAHLITDYNNFVTEMKDLLTDAISKVNDEELQKRFEKILKTKTISNIARDYEDLVGQAFKLTNVMRIERTNYINSIFGKTGDLTIETICKLIKEGECDAWFSLIQKDINDIKLDDDINNIQDSLTGRLNAVMTTLKDNDYEDNNSQTYHKITDFVDEVDKNKDKLKRNQYAVLIRSANALRAIID